MILFFGFTIELWTFYMGDLGYKNDSHESHIHESRFFNLMNRRTNGQLTLYYNAGSKKVFSSQLISSTAYWKSLP